MEKIFIFGTPENSVKKMAQRISCIESDAKITGSLESVYLRLTRNNFIDWKKISISDQIYLLLWVDANVAIGGRNQFCRDHGIHRGTLSRALKKFNNSIQTGKIEFYGTFGRPRTLDDIALKDLTEVITKHYSASKCIENNFKFQDEVIKVASETKKDVD